MTDIWTIGHSTRDLASFIEMLTSFRIELLADVRRFPHSRRNPHFNTDELKRSLFQHGIKYEYLGDSLGGFRHKKKGSRHVGLHNSSFQGYADHMETPIFRKGFERLLALAEGERVAYMCSESNFKSCHRRMISDRITLMGLATVHHIVDTGKEMPHEPMHEARLVDGELLYGATPLDAFDASEPPA